MGHIINLDEYSDIGTNWVVLYVQSNDVTYFDSFGVEHVSKEIRTFISDKNIKTNIFRIQAYNSKQISIYKQYCMDIFVLHLLILCLQERL